MVLCGQRGAVEPGAGLETNPSVAICESGVTPRCVSDARRIGFQTAKSRRTIPPRRNLDTILNRHRLIRWVARILQGIRDSYGPAVAACEPSAARGSAVPRWASRLASGHGSSVEQTLNQPLESGLPTSGSPQESTLSWACVQLAVWRQIWGLHNKERARERNPLTSANPLFSPRSFSHHVAR